MSPEIVNKIETFFSSYPVRHFKKGQILVYGGEQPGHVFYLVSGKVRQYDINDKGNEVVVNVFKPPAFFPMSWAINKSHNYYFFETTEPVSLHQAPPDDVITFLKENPDVSFDLLSRLYSGVDGLQRRMAHLMGGSARNRTIFELITECVRFGASQKDGSQVISINERELAERTGLSRETVSRELAKLKAKNLVHSNTGHSIRISSVTALKDELADSL